MSDNPFQPPVTPSEPIKTIGSNGRHQGLGVVNQIQVIAILMIVHGVLLLIMSGFFFFYAFGFTAIMRSMPNQPGQEFPTEANGLAHIRRPVADQVDKHIIFIGLIQLVLPSSVFSNHWTTSRHQVYSRQDYQTARLGGQP